MLIVAFDTVLVAFVLKAVYTYLVMDFGSFELLMLDNVCV